VRGRYEARAAFFVLGRLMDGPRPGRQLRDALLEARWRGSWPKFFRLMAKLEERGLVRRYRQADMVPEIEVHWFALEDAGRGEWARLQLLLISELQREGTLPSFA
jgi:hypothetical protein